jgi:hypothetical protein
MNALFEGPVTYLDAEDLSVQIYGGVPIAEKHLTRKYQCEIAKFGTFSNSYIVSK